MKYAQYSGEHSHCRLERMNRQDMPYGERDTCIWCAALDGNNRGVAAPSGQEATSLTSQATTFEDVLDSMGALTYTNKGVSMMPLLREDRDVMVIRKKGPERCQRLDVVLFKRPYVTGRGAYVLHRVLRVNDDGTYWIVGDNCIGGETVPEERILGVLEAVVRDGKTIPVTSRGYLVYSHLWCGFYPVRVALLRARGVVGRGVRGVRKLLGFRR